MTTIKFLRPFDLEGVTVDAASEPTVTATRVTLPLVDDDRLVLTGRFDRSSDEAFEASTFTKLSILDGAAGTTPLVAITGFRAQVGDIGSFASFLDDLTLGDDKITGTAGDDVLRGLGGEGDDRVAGGNGRDLLIGSAGRDVLLGGGGDDTLLAANDADILTGGRGADDFSLGSGSEGTDITDFRRTDGDQVIIDRFLFVVDVDLSTDEDPGQFVDLRAVGGGVELRFDRNGGGDNFETLATIRGDFGTDLDQLLNSGVLSSGSLF